LLSFTVPAGSNCACLRAISQEGSNVIDTSTEFGQRVERRLGSEKVCWLTTVTPSGQPKSIPIWFLWQDDGTVLFYSQPDTLKLRNIAANPKVSVNLNSEFYGNDVIRLEGEAEVPEEYPPASDVPAYVEKYRENMASLNATPEQFAEEYSVPILLKPARLRGF
jgi:PPOX class probable F420-dependent enzyme